MAAYFSVATLALFGFGVPCFAVFILIRRRGQLLQAFGASDKALAYAPGTEQEKREMSYLDEDGHIKIDQWSRFLSSDHSTMSVMYQQILPKWIFYMPILLVVKFILLCPPIFFEPNSIQQATGTGVAEALNGLFLFITSAYMSPWLDIMNRIGAAHQLFMLGLVALNNVDQFVQAGWGISNWILANTIIYLIIVAGAMVGLVVLPSVEPVLEAGRQRAMILNLGLPSTQTAPKMLGRCGGVEKCVLRHRHNDWFVQDMQLTPQPSEVSPKP